ncbi:hypothetical protein Hanom_Chr09g00801241 [Helianthus anomalus]
MSCSENLCGSSTSPCPDRYLLVKWQSFIFLVIITNQHNLPNPKPTSTSVTLPFQNPRFLRGRTRLPCSITRINGLHHDDHHRL